jgi:hypothetical protein
MEASQYLQKPNQGKQANNLPQTTFVRRVIPTEWTQSKRRNGNHVDEIVDLAKEICGGWAYSETYNKLEEEQALKGGLKPIEPFIWHFPLPHSLGEGDHDTENQDEGHENCAIEVGQLT